ncbi:hypothetical protein ACFL1B_00505 [Nanoarchaeota archaeon]
MKKIILMLVIAFALMSMVSAVCDTIDSDCDGIDDDCDGVADDEYVTTVSNCGVGECAETGLLQCVLSSPELVFSDDFSTDPYANGWKEADGFGNTDWMVRSGRLMAELRAIANIANDARLYQENIISFAAKNITLHVPHVDFAAQVDKPRHEAKMGFGTFTDPSVPYGQVRLSSDVTLRGVWCENSRGESGGRMTADYIRGVYDITVNVDLLNNKLNCIVVLPNGTVLTHTMPLLDTSPRNSVVLRASDNEGSLQRHYFDDLAVYADGHIEINTCEPGEPHSEACDGLDNDCDAADDDGSDESWYNLETACGVANCASTGMYICQDGTQVDTCEPTGIPEEEVCDGIDNDCDAEVDEGGDALCADELYCNGDETCQGVAGCAVGTPVECSENDLEEVSTCTNEPDGNPYTKDFAEGFESSCDDDLDVCTEGFQELTHSCSVLDCGAGCDENSVWADSCAGDSINYAGTCDLDACTWSFSLEDCNLQDNWYDVSPAEYQEVTIDDCNTMKQMKQEYKDYTCGNAECIFQVTEYQWIDVEVIVNDEDGDGICDGLDKCSSNIPGDDPWSAEQGLKPNHYDSSNWVDAFGCSCAQVLYCKPGNNGGEYKFGCSQGTKEIWEAQNAWAVDCQVDGVVAMAGAEKPVLENTDGDWLPDLVDSDNDNDGLSDAEDSMIDDQDLPGDPDYGIPDWHPKSKHKK